VAKTQYICTAGWDRRRHYKSFKVGYAGFTTVPLKP